METFSGFILCKVFMVLSDISEKIHWYRLQEEYRSCKYTEKNVLTIQFLRELEYELGVYCVAPVTTFLLMSLCIITM